MQSNNSALQSEMVTDLDRWSDLEAEWSALFDRSPNKSIFLSYAWLDGWWRKFGPVYGAFPGGLRIVLVRENGKLLAALPLYLQVRRPAGLLPLRRLLFIGTGESSLESVYPEKLDLLHLSFDNGTETSVTALVQKCIEEIPWDEFDSGVIQEEGLLSLILPKLRVTSLPLRRTYPGPWINISEGFESYLEKRSSNARQQFRRHLRDAEKRELSLVLASTASEKEKFLQELIELHQARWTLAGYPGAFAAESVKEFHFNLLRRAPDGSVVLARLGDERPEAVLYGFRFGQVFDFVQSGVCAPEHARLRSPGLTAHLLLLQVLAKQGVRRYDLLAGASDYKEKLATDESPYMRCRRFKLTVGNALGLTNELGNKLCTRFLRAAPSCNKEVPADA